MANRPSAVAFDVLETLMPLEPLAARFERIGLPASALREWFTRLLLYGIGLSAAGGYVPFPADVTGADLTEVTDGLERVIRNEQCHLADTSLPRGRCGAMQCPQRAAAAGRPSRRRNDGWLRHCATPEAGHPAPVRVEGGSR